ncbi:SusC/RagA family TonB-linked outer membrane protein [Cyclobacterium amurskyense]|uniref:TonB-dependent receptor plug n=1 Tax=Cyclobacterium amurskyense TaxID=320787 RepID=A0A0H4PIF0_9BACT|nr:TonB-dependent receptor [Cyclobacterium amurskyense]AKP52683.1 TonB-dependent receptor plug [Cyclobacterium amurskyense]
MKKSLHFYRDMQPMSWLSAILFCLFSGGLMAQSEGLNKNLENINKDQTVLASAKLKNANAEFDVTITGVVTDENGMPIPGVTVSVPGTSIGTATDLDGKYTLTVAENASVIFSFIGFESQTVNVANRSTINITLKEDTQSLDEVVVVGYGTQEKVNLTGAVGVATSERLQNRPIANVGEGLQGVIPNLNIAPRNGDPSQSPSFNIRGYQSINGGSPLILVDNVPMDINRINPNDIESISVLKDAAAAAVYGARAAFGVVLVTTKSGKEGKVRVSLNSQYSLGKPIFNMDPVTDPYEFVQARNLANIRTNGVPSYDQDMIDGTKRWSENPIPENEWGVANGSLRFYGFNNYTEKIMTDFAPSQQHDLSISGGSENSKYFVSIGHLNKDGYLNSDRNENFKRYNILMKAEFKVTDWLTLDEKIVVNSQQSDKPYFYNWDVNINTLARVNPIMPITFPDLPYYVTEGDRDTYAPYIGKYFGGTNFFPYLEDGGRSTWTNNDIWLTQGVTLNPVEGLTIKSNFSYNFFHRSEQDVASKIEIVDTNLLAAGLISNGFSGNDFINEESRYNQYYVFNAFADYKFQLPEVHSLTAMVGFNQEWGQNKFIRAQANTLLTPLITDLNATTGLQQTFGSSSHVSLRGAFYRVNYIFDERFLLEANGRYDGTSRFPSDSRFGFFPSFSAGYRISNENWMASTKSWMDELKIRGSYGTLGNQLLGSNYYPYIPTLGTGQSGFMLSAGQRTPYVSAAGLVSPTLTWETVVSQNIGVDFTLFGGKIDASFDVYSRETKDMLMRRDYPSILGTGAPQSNAADLKTTGWELAVTWKDRVKDELFYDVTLALSDWTAEITKFENPEGVINQYYVGQKLGEIWGYETVGIFQSQEEVDNAPDQSRLGANWRAGDIQYADLNGDGIISTGNGTLSDPGDRKIIGNDTPRLSFGLNNNLQWKNFTLNLFFQGIWKRDHWPTSGNWTWFFPFNAGHVEKYFITDSWSEDNRDAYFAAPHISTNDKKNIQTQSRFLQNAGYIRLKNANLGYNLPQNWMETIGFQNANIYFSGMNLWEYSPIRKPLDPETIYAGAIEYPMQRVYTLGARITF